MRRYRMILVVLVGLFMTTAGGADPNKPMATPATRPASSPATTKPGVIQYTYLGKPRTQAWFEDKYKRFADKIARVDGNYVDIGQAVADPKGLYDSPLPTAGEYRIVANWFEIQSIINAEEAIIVRNRGTLIFHVSRFSTKNLVDHTRFEPNSLIYLGTYRYLTVMGSVSTVPSYVPYVPLTKEQFADALAKGFKLVEYRLMLTYKVDRRLPPDKKIVTTPVQ